MRAYHLSASNYRIQSRTKYTVGYKQARSGNDASSTYLYAERIPLFLHTAVPTINIAFHG